MDREIGGYIEFETYHNRMLHSDGIKLNCGRNCLAYLIRSKKIEKIVMPYFMCDSVFEVCQKFGVQIRYYHIDSAFSPCGLELKNGEWLYLMSYYGQMTTLQIQGYIQRFQRVIVDFTHDYFHEPIIGADTLYTCRKFFGVPDGAILYTDATEAAHTLQVDESYEHMRYLLGRFERTASEFYKESVENNQRFSDVPVKKMSCLTENLLCAIDYGWVKDQRTRNYLYLHKHLNRVNQLQLREIEGAFAYPLMVKDAAEIRQKLIQQKIYIPVLWPNVLEEQSPDTLEYSMARDILPIPCDQRYGQEEMEYILKILKNS